MNQTSRRAAEHTPGVYTSLAELLALRYSAERLDVFKPQLARSMLLGNVRSRFRGRGMEFEEVRQYQPGDDVRMIDWRVSARTGKTHTKLFAEERERPVHIMVDQRSSMFFGSGDQFKSVLAARLAAAVAWASLRASDRIGGQVIADTSEVSVRAKRNRRAVMQLLAGIVDSNHALPGTSDSRTAMSDALESCRRLIRPGTSVFLISDMHDLDADCAQLLSSIGRHADVLLIQVRDPIETEFDLNGQLGFSDGRRSRTLDISPELARRYRDTLSQADAALEHIAAGAKAMVSPVTTTDDAVEFLARLYHG